jgi:uncharacterized repeat protein (TIGR04138 family)
MAKLARHPSVWRFSMLGQPDPIVPVPSSDPIKNEIQVGFNRLGIVSLWVGTFASVEDSEVYFGIPDEIGVYLPPEAFMADFGLGDFQPDNLEVNFEQVSPRSLAELLRDVTFADSFVHQALDAAVRQGIYETQGVALLYNFDYRLKSARCDVAGPLRFIGAFPFVEVGPGQKFGPYYEAAQEIGCPTETVLLVMRALRNAPRKSWRGPGGEIRHITAREYCDFLLRCRGDDTPAILRELGLRRSEDVGRVLYALIKRGLARRQDSDSESDFEGLFDIG